MPNPVPPLILASRSPRRAELLERLGLEFEIQPADIDESFVDHLMPADHAERLAREKAVAISQSRPSAMVIGSDTSVILGADVLGKPRDDADAVRMLQRLAGRTHDVLTGVAVVHGRRVESAVERVKVRFRAFGQRTAEAYVATGEPMDKAGAYGIQGYGSSLVERIEGDYFAVMGLPVVRTLALLERFGWRYHFGRLEAVE